MVPERWADPVWCYLEPSKFHCLCSKYKLVKVEDDTTEATDVNPGVLLLGKVTRGRSNFRSCFWNVFCLL